MITLKKAVIYSLTLLSFVTLPMSLNAKEYRLEQPNLIIDIPAGFKQSQRFKGFEQIETFSTIKIEDIALPLSSAMADQFKSNLETLESENVTISDKDGILIKHKNQLGGQLFHQWTLLFGDKLSSVRIVASYPANMDKSLGPIIKQSLLSSKMRGITVERIFKGLPFKLNTTESMVYDTRTQNSIILREKAPFDISVIAPTYIVSHAEHLEKIEDNPTFALQWLQRDKMFTDFEIIEQGNMTVAGVGGYRIVATAKHKKNAIPVLFYQVVAVNENRFLLSHGIAPVAELKRYVIKFDKITDNIAFKEAAEL